MNIFIHRRDLRLNDNTTINLQSKKYISKSTRYAQNNNYLSYRLNYDSKPFDTAPISYFRQMPLFLGTMLLVHRNRTVLGNTQAFHSV